MSNPYQPQQSNPGQVPGPQPGQPMGQPMGQQMPGQPMPGQFTRPYEHPQEQTVMVLAIIGIFFWLCSPIAWYMGSKAKSEMVAQNMEPTSRLNLDHSRYGDHDFGTYWYQSLYHLDGCGRTGDSGNG